MIKKLLLPFFLVLVQITAFGANISSTSTGGNWSASSTWVGGVVPASTDNVTIVSGSTVTLDVTPIYANTITISGTLDLNKNADIYLYSSLIVVTSPNGHINFDHSVLRLPSNVALYLQNGSASLNGSCNNNDEIFVGTTQYAVCVGGGALYLFDQIETAGGINVVTTGAIGTSQIICSGVTPSTLTSTTPGTGSGTITYEWQTNASGSYVTIDSETAATYSPPALSSTTSYKRRTKSVVQGTTFYSVFTTAVTITVNPLPSAYAVTGGGSYCSGGTGVVVGLSNSTSGVNYQLQIGGVNTGTVVTGTGSAISFGLKTIAGNYTVMATNAATSCTLAMTGSVSVIVNPLPLITTQPLSQLDCEGSLVNFKVIATGTNLSYVWKYKKPADSAFITLTGTETNTTYPNTPINNEIRLANVGSAQYPNGTQFQVVVSNGTCSITSSIATLSVNEITGINSPLLTPSQSVNDVTLCYGSNYSYTATISNPSNGPVSYQWKSQVASGTWNNVVDGTHFSGSATATLNIINGTPTESAKYRVDVVYNRTGGNCSVSSFSKTRLLTFLPLLTMPQITIAQPDCTISTGAITVTVQSASDTYSFDNGLTYQSSNVKLGLVAGPCNIFIKNIGGCVSPVKNSTIIAVPAAAIWNGSWTNGPPTSVQALIFNGSYTIAGDMEACSCQVNSGTVTINSGHTLKITNGVTVSGGSLIFEDTASLVQINSINNIGNITFRRLTSPISNLDYTYWSSPVSPQTLFNVSPNTLSDKFYSFNGSTDSWVQESPSKTMDKGIGYIIRGPQNYVAPNPPGLYQASFVGVPNNGSVQIPITTSVESSYLLGNPYPSALDADTFIKNNPILDGTLYFWTHNTNIGTNVSSPGSGVYAYSGDDYASYNLTGGAGTGAGLAAGSSTNLGSFNATIPSGKIGSGQGFFVTTKTSGTITFANTMRVGVGAITGNNSEFFKFQSSKSTEIVEKSRVWLNLFSTEGIFKQLLVGYITGATNDIDSSYDGDSFDGNEYLDFYSINNDRKLVIQGRSLPFDNNDKVPLGYRSEIEGNFTIAIDEVDGLFKDQVVFIEDKLLNVVHNLKKDSYTFTTGKGVFDDRFVLSYTNKTLAIDNFDIIEKGVLISNKNKEVKINSSVENIDTVLIYDLLGRQIYKKSNVNNKELIILNLLSTKQTLLIKVGLQGGEVIHKKIIY
ncbi:T9SS sorting signal type C domain-containing protein [Flavobacterium sp. WC2430]|uniref:T9SS sorting signal type C domain-containing protein n=1 Tax=Flavobacterium sp. WC2430 TaxID=3234137 RepID=UPI00346611B1